MSELKDREQAKALQARSVGAAHTTRRFDVPVVVDVSKCITGCRVCIESCPVDCQAVDAATSAIASFKKLRDELSRTKADEKAIATEIDKVLATVQGLRNKLENP